MDIACAFDWRQWRRFYSDLFMRPQMSKNIGVKSAPIYSDLFAHLWAQQKIGVKSVPLAPVKYTSDINNFA